MRMRDKKGEREERESGVPAGVAPSARAKGGLFGTNHKLALFIQMVLFGVV